MADTVVPRLLLLSDAPRIASYSLQEPSRPDIEIGQAEHRIDLVNSWGIALGSRVLEIGCGQGNTTAVLAEAVGDGGSVDAVDPATPEYGSPFTLAEAQAHLSASPVGNRINWHEAAPEAFLERSSGETWDVAVLAHCIWYFASPQVLVDILTNLRGRVQRVCIAEYALQATERAAEPHVLAALATGMLESHKIESSVNIRSPLGPAAIAEAARVAGWARPESLPGVAGEKEKKEIVVPRAGLLDGSWEAGTVTGDDFANEIEDQITDERVRVVLRSARDATIAAVRGLQGEQVRTMDVWVAAFA